MNPKADKDLDQSTREQLNALLHKDPNDMSETDKDFLRARKYYIKDKHIARLKDVFDPKKNKKADPKKEQTKKVEDKKPEDKKPVEKFEGQSDPTVESDEDEDYDEDEELDDEDEDGEAAG